jgi:hypothetical protein
VRAADDLTLPDRQPFKAPRHHARPDGPGAVEVVQAMAGCTRAYLAVNFKDAGLPAVLEATAENDLFCDAPEEVRTEHSLHVFGSEELPGWEPLLTRLAEKGSLTVLFSDHPKGAVVEGLRAVLAWYARPGILKTQLDEGSSHLARKLLAGVFAVLVVTRPDAGWLVYVNPELAPAPELLGLPGPLDT